MLSDLVKIQVAIPYNIRRLKSMTLISVDLVHGLYFFSCLENRPPPLSIDEEFTVSFWRLARFPVIFVAVLANVAHSTFRLLFDDRRL